MNVHLCQIIPILLLLSLIGISCHGDSGPKLILISFPSNLTKFDIPSMTKSINVALKGKSDDKNDNLKSILNGCRSDHKRECEPIWVTNQNNHHESAIMNWPNQLKYDNVWPTFSFGLTPADMPLGDQWGRMLNWMNRHSTSLGIMFIDQKYSHIEQARDFLANLSLAASQRELNFIIIGSDISSKKSHLVAFGPNFASSANQQLTTMNVVDIYLVMSNILRLNAFNDHTDGNATLAAFLAPRLSHHVAFTTEKLIIFSAMIGCSAIISCIMFIGAVRSRSGKFPKHNHQYNLGMTTGVNSAGFPEKAYLLNASDEDELFSDALLHIQTSRPQ